MSKDKMRIKILEDVIEEYNNLINDICDGFTLSEERKLRSETKERKDDIITNMQARMTYYGLNDEKGKNNL